MLLYIQLVTILTYRIRSCVQVVSLDVSGKVLVLEVVSTGFSVAAISTRFGNACLCSLTCIALVEGLIDGALALLARERLLASSLVAGGRATSGVLRILRRLAVDKVGRRVHNRGSGIGDGLHAEQLLW